MSVNTKPAQHEKHGPVLLGWLLSRPRRVDKRALSVGSRKKNSLDFPDRHSLSHFSVSLDLALSSHVHALSSTKLDQLLNQTSFFCGHETTPELEVTLVTGAFTRR